MSVELFRTIPNHENYEINIKGDVRNKNNKYVLKHFNVDDGINEYVNLKIDGSLEASHHKLIDLLLEVFPELIPEKIEYKITFKDETNGPENIIKKTFSGFVNNEQKLPIKSISLSENARGPHRCRGHKKGVWNRSNGEDIEIIKKIGIDEYLKHKYHFYVTLDEITYTFSENKNVTVPYYKRVCLGAFTRRMFYTNGRNEKGELISFDNKTIDTNWQYLYRNYQPIIDEKYQNNKEYIKFRDCILFKNNQMVRKSFIKPKENVEQNYINYLIEIIKTI